MGKQLTRTMSITSACSDLSELICEAGLGPEKEGAALSLIDSIKAEEKRWEGENNRLDDLVRKLEDEVASLEDADDEIDFSTSISGIGTIDYRAENLLDQQVMERLGELIDSAGCLKVLEALQSIKI